MDRRLKMSGGHRDIVTNRPITLISASDGATITAENIGCVYNNGNYTEEEKEQMQKAKIDKLKNVYKDLYKKHEIHSVDDDRIVLKEKDVCDFAVKLKIGCDCRSRGTFQDEAKRYLDNIGDVTGQAISNSAELYCWTVFLLLKQHADKDGSSRKMASEVFREFSQTLSTISEVCYYLLTKNKIIFEGSIESRLGDIGKDKEFVESLFVDVSDNITEKYQFKHLSLMEFLSALYICKQDWEHLMKVIKDHLKEGFIEVVSFVCRLLSGFSYEGIIKEMLMNGVGLKEEVNGKQLLDDVIDLLDKCELYAGTKLSRSFEIITFFLNKNFKDKKSIMSIIRKCHGDQFVSYELTTSNICLICRHLESCGWKEDDIRLAFANVQFEHINVSMIEQLDVVTVKKRFRIGYGGIEFKGMKTTVNALRDKFKGGDHTGYSGSVVTIECEFMDEEVNGRSSNDRQLEGLRILRGCQIKTMQSFLNICDWGMSCKEFMLRELDINNEWWERMVEMMEERQWKGALKMEQLKTYKCSTRMNTDMEKRIVHCGVKLWTDDGKVTRPLQSESDLTTQEDEDLQLPEVDQQKKPPSPSTSPSTVDLPPLAMSTSICMTSTQVDVHSTIDHLKPPHSSSSGTPSHDVRTPSQYPAPPTSSSSPSAGRPTFQVLTSLTDTSTTRHLSPVDPQLTSPHSSCSSLPDDDRDGVQKRPRLS